MLSFRLNDCPQYRQRVGWHSARTCAVSHAMCFCERGSSSLLLLLLYHGLCPLATSSAFGRRKTNGPGNARKPPMVNWPRPARHREQAVQHPRPAAICRHCTPSLGTVNRWVVPESRQGCQVTDSAPKEESTMGRMGEKYSPRFKEKVALETIRGQRTSAELGSDYSVPSASSSPVTGESPVR
jgi:hypothetical protein